MTTTSISQEQLDKVSSMFALQDTSAVSFGSRLKLTFPVPHVFRTGSPLTAIKGQELKLVRTQLQLVRMRIMNLGEFSGPSEITLLHSFSRHVYFVQSKPTPSSIKRSPRNNTSRRSTGQIDKGTSGYIFYAVGSTCKSCSKFHCL